MDLGLRGRVAIVCAASQGLGKAAALGFALEGANVVMCSRNRKKITAAAGEIQEAAGRRSVVMPVVADLTKPLHIKRLVSTAAQRFGRIDVLVTNAGGPPVATFSDLTDVEWTLGVDLTLLSAVRTIREVLPHMRKRGWGRIIAITSVAAKQPINDLVISSSLRPGILGLMKSLANTHAADGILVNAVAPGYIMTGRQQEISTARAASAGMSMDDYVKQSAREVPLGRFGQPEELANIIVFLGSERSSYVTGATIGVDGGLAKGLF